TVVTAAARQNNPPDCGPAQQAGFPLTAIHSMLELEEAFLSIRVHVIGNRRSAQRDRLAQNFLYRGMQLAQLLPGDGCRPPPGTDAGAEQRLVGIDVAHAAQQFLVQESALDRSLAPAK